MIAEQNSKLAGFKKLRRVVLLAFLLVCTLLLSRPAMASDVFSVSFLNPGGRGDAFFDMMVSFMEAAADDLGIEFETIYCDRNHLKMHEEGVKLLSRKNLPDYLVLINEKDAGKDVLRLASDKGVKVALINEGLQSRDRERFGGPGELLPNWILEILPDDRQAGFLLGQYLIAAARAQGLTGDAGEVNIVAISGNYQTGSSTSRVDGLRQAVLNDGKAFLLQVVPGYWDEKHAGKVAKGLLERYPRANVLWSASDLMAKGAVDSLHGMKGRPLKKMTVGGVDWAEFALHMVERGTLSATVGGHFMDGGWALVMLFDLHNGIPLEKSSYRTRFSLIDEKNIEAYLDYFGRHDWSRIDFSRFSKKYNPELTEYAFGLDALMTQLRSMQ